MVFADEGSVGNTDKSIIFYCKECSEISGDGSRRDSHSFRHISCKKKLNNLIKAEREIVSHEDIIK